MQPTMTQPGYEVDQFDKDVFKLANQVRANPKNFIPHLNDLKQRFDGLLLKPSSDSSKWQGVSDSAKTTLRSKEGVAAVNEAIQKLKHQAPVRTLNWHNELALTAARHTQDAGKKGLVQHESSDGTTVKDRLKKQGKIITCYGENLAFHADSAMEVVLQSIVDDGVPNRGHRDNLFNPDFRVMGCNTGPHVDFHSMTTIDFCTAFVGHSEDDPIERQMDIFLREEIDFEQMPADIRGWKQNSKISVQGHIATKTVTRTCRLKDGQNQTFTKEQTREFDV